MYMNHTESLNLKRLVRDSECEDNTGLIRKLKHSEMIKTDLEHMQKLKVINSKMRNTEPDKFSNLCQSKCNFLYTNYTDIYHKNFKDELNLQLMANLLEILRKIENGEVDQHEGSVMVGKILKEIYVDSALKGGENLDKKYANDEEKPTFVEPRNISWKEFKNKSL